MNSNCDEECLPSSDGEEKNRVEKGWLYLVATPIGNLADLSPRALKVLREVDLIAAEDTRNTARLLSFFGITGKGMLSYHEHNKRVAGEQVVKRLQDGLSVALVTDAGMPAISDPGEDLVALCLERGYPVTVVPGCCAAVTALALSGLPTGRFAFEGFLPEKTSERRARLEAVHLDERTLIFYASPHKIRADLRDLLAALGERKVVLCRELTKRNEQVQRETLSSAIAYFETQDPRGEYVLVVEGAPKSQIRGEAFFAGMTLEEHLAHYLEKGYGKMDAIKAVAKDRGLPKGEVYKQFL